MLQNGMPTAYFYIPGLLVSDNNHVGVGSTSWKSQAKMAIHLMYFHAGIFTSDPGTPVFEVAPSPEGSGVNPGVPVGVPSGWGVGQGV